MQTKTDTRLGRLLAALPFVAVAFPPAWGASTDEDVIELSPFEVRSSENDIGYYAENTLAGSRLNTNVGDLAASITVVTKQQLEDTGAIDINDVFLYESNTEGTGTYTDFNIDTRGAVQDRSAGFQGGAPALPYTPSTSNRVRGVGSVDKMRDYYPGNARLPFDSYNTESVEISRGPNSILFGLGSPAGIVNQSVSRARLDQSTNQVEFRIGTAGALRTSVAFNRPLIEGKLAFHFAALYDERGFEREPSYDVTRRQYGAITFRPFEKTTLRANIENFDNANRRPNSVTPRDFVSPWIAAGRPSFNPVTRMLTMNGVTTGPYSGSLGSDSDALMANSGNTISYDGNTRPVLSLERLGSEEEATELSWMMRRLSSTPTDPMIPAALTFNSIYRTTKSLGPVTRQNIIPGRPAGLTYAEPGVQDRSIYDWEKINIISGNFGKDEAKVYNFELEQEITPDFHVQLGWYREDFDSQVDYYISQQTGVTLYVDTNTTLLDGSTNPNFGRPFIELTQPDQFLHPEKNETIRATAAYEFDFTDKDGWLGSLGRHQLLGLWSQQDIDRLQIRNRPYVASNHLWNPVVPNVWSGNTTQNAIERRFYVGDSQGFVTKDPGLYPDGTRTNTLRWFNPTAAGTDPFTGLSGAWQEDDALVDTGLHFVSFNTKQEIESRALVLQSNFLDDRIITTLGRRRDESDASQGNFSTILPNGLSDPSNLTQANAGQIVADYTSSYGVVVKPLDWLSLHYNKSDNFQPAGFATDFFNNPLPLPAGEGKDWGFGLTLLENKLYARVNWFEASSNNAREALIGQARSRTFNIDDEKFRAWAQWVSGSATNNSAAVNAILDLPAFHAAAAPGAFFGVPVNATSTVNAEGMELQVIYNPVHNWNIKVTAGSQETVFSEIGPEWDAWIAERMPLWTSASAAGFPNFWATTGADLNASPLAQTFGLGASQTVEDWFFTNVGAIVSTAKRNSGKVTQDQRKWRWNVITNYQFTDGSLKDFGVGGALRWEDKAAIGYLGDAPDSDGIIRGLNVDRPVFDDSNLYVDLWASYNFRWLDDRVRTKLQLNVRNALEGGGLQPIAVNPDGQYTAFRIVDPRQIFFTTTFEF